MQRQAHKNIRLAAPWVVAIITVTTNCCGATAFPKQEREDITQKEFAKPSGDFVKDFQGSKREFIKEFGFDADKSHDTATPEEIIAEKKRMAEAEFKRKLQTAKLPESFDLAVKYHQFGDLEKAIPFYKLALTQDPKFQSAYNNLALGLLERKAEGDSDEAKELLAQSEKVASEEVSPKPAGEGEEKAAPSPTKAKVDEKLFVLGLVSEQSGDLPKAAEFYQQFMNQQQQSTNLVLINHLSSMLTKMGNFNGARAVLKRGILSAPPEEHMKILYEALTNLDNKTKANKVE